MASFSQRFSRKSQTDNFRVFLKVLWLVQGFVIYFLCAQFADGFALYGFLKSVRDAGRTEPGDLVCLKGTVKFFGGSKTGSVEENLENVIRAEFGLKTLVWYRAIFTHTVKRGKSSHTVTDASISSFRPFTLKTAAGEVALPSNPNRIFSPRAVSFRCRGGFSGIAPDSTDVELEYLSGEEFFVIGTVGPVTRGYQTIVSDRDHSVMLSELPLDSLRTSIKLSMLASGAAILFFLVTLLVEFRPSIKARFEENPGQFFVFDITSGSETIAMGVISIFIIFWVFWISGSPEAHSFLNDRKFAFTSMFFFGLMNMARSVEGFYVAGKREGHFFYISRGFLFQKSERIVPLNKLQPYIDRIVGSKGAVSYVIKGHGNAGPLSLTDSYSRSADPEQILKDFRDFL